MRGFLLSAMSSNASFLRIATLACLLAAAPMRAAEGAAEPADARRLLEWTPLLAETIQTSNLAPCLVARNLAIAYAAAFDAANAAAPAYEFYALEGPPEDPVHGGLAAVSAMSRAATLLFPSHRAAFRELREVQFAVWADALPEPLFDRSRAFGESVAKRLLELRAGDGSTSTRTYFPQDAVGRWRRTPPSYRPPELPNWAATRPFVIDRADQFRPPPPPPLDSERYAKALEEVKTLGARDSAVRAAEQAEIAEFWSCFSYTSTPAGHWHEIATKLAREEELPLLESARLLALVSLAMADAGIACWDAKYHYEFWRPVHAIRAADRDGNPVTEPDPDWISLLEAPPHPEYVSGHASFSGAGGRILELFLGAEDGYPFSTTSSSLPGVVRRFDSFGECVEEIGMSRLYGGIHYRFSNEAGAVLGEKIADVVYARVLRPLPGESLAAKAE